MAPPLFVRTRLIACPNCAVHVRDSESRCPYCDATLSTAGSPPLVLAPIVMGLALAGCTGDDAGDTGVGTTGPMQDTGNHDDRDDHDGPGPGPNSMSGTGSTAADTMVTTDDAGEAEYGVPDTGEATATTGEGGSSGGTSGSSTDGSGSDSVGEPEYGVGETAGPEPLYGAGMSDQGS